MDMDTLGTVVSVIGGCLFVLLVSGDGFLLKEFFRWLKGSRVTYYIDQNGGVSSSVKKLRTPADRVGTDLEPRNQGVIELSHGRFRQLSAIYGDFHLWPWKIADVGVGRTSLTSVSVDLQDKRGLPVETALRVINTYPSLQAMLDRIAELEKQNAELEKQNAGLVERSKYLGDVLVRAEEQVVELWSSIVALAQTMQNDKQKYRSKAAAHTSQCLTRIHDWMATNVAKDSLGLSYLRPSPERTRVWKEERFPALKD